MSHYEVWVIQVLFVLISNVGIAAEISSTDQESVVIKSTASENCLGLQDVECLSRKLNQIYYHANVALKSLPDGSAYVNISILKNDGDCSTGFVTLDGVFMNNQERRAFESAAWQRFHAKHGKISPELVAELDSQPINEELPIVFWLASPGIDEAEHESSVLPEHLCQNPQQDFYSFAIANGISADSLYMLPGVPAVRAEVTPLQIQTLGHYEGLATAYRFSKPEPEYCGYSSVWDESVIDFDSSGYGINVCVLEEALPISSQYLSRSGQYYTGAGAVFSTHARHVCGMIRNSAPVGPNGVANNAQCYFGNWIGTPYDDPANPAYYGCIWNAPYVWNFSHGSQGGIDHFFDFWAERWPNPLVVASSGNLGHSRVTSAGFNMLVVGCADDNSTSSRSDDRAFRYCTANGPYRYSYINPQSQTSWNPTGDRELPMISAPCSVAVLGNTMWGTSYAAALVSGAAATLIDENTLLAGKPYALRAILMAGASSDIDLTWFNPADRTVDERDGAGELNIWLSGLIGNSLFKVSPNNSVPMSLGHDYRTLDLDSDFDSTGYSVNRYYIDGQTNGAPFRVVLAWNATATCSDASASDTCSQSHIDADLNLVVRDTLTGTVVAYSDSLDNSFEFVQFVPPAGDHEYEVLIYRASASEASTKYGIAWIAWPFEDNDVNGFI